MSATTPQHVLDFNETNGPAKYGGLHFDDPAYDGEDSASTKLYSETVKPVKDTDDNTDLAAWLRTQTWSEFAVSLAQFHADRGYLTEKQVASAKSMKAKIDARNAERNQAQSDPNGLDLSELPSGLYGVPDGDTRLKVRVNHVTSGKWEGFTFVDDGGEYGAQQKYGMQRPDGTYRGKIEDQLRKIIADIPEAQQEYARLTGRCYVCNRKLEDETSVALGIGPICRS